MGEEYVPTGVDEWIKFMKWILNADPVSSLQIGAVRSMSPSMRYLILRGLEFLSALQQAKVECKGRGSNLYDECVREVVEARTGVDFETFLNGLKNLSTVATYLRSLSSNAQYLVSKVTKYILLGERREVSYNIGGWLGKSGIEFSRLVGGLRKVRKRSELD